MQRRGFAAEVDVPDGMIELIEPKCTHRRFAPRVSSYQVVQRDGNFAVFESQKHPPPTDISQPNPKLASRKRSRPTSSSLAVPRPVSAAPKRPALPLKEQVQVESREAEATELQARILELAQLREAAVAELLSTCARPAMSPMRQQSTARVLKLMQGAAIVRERTILLVQAIAAMRKRFDRNYSFNWPKSSPYLAKVAVDLNALDDEAMLVHALGVPTCIYNPFLCAITLDDPQFQRYQISPSPSGLAALQSKLLHSNEVDSDVLLACLAEFALAIDLDALDGPNVDRPESPSDYDRGNVMESEFMEESTSKNQAWFNDEIPPAPNPTIVPSTQAAPVVSPSVVATCFLEWVQFRWFEQRVRRKRQAHARALVRRIFRAWWRQARRQSLRRRALCRRMLYSWKSQVRRYQTAGWLRHQHQRRSLSTTLRTWRLHVRKQRATSRIAAWWRCHLAKRMAKEARHRRQLALDTKLEATRENFETQLQQIQAKVIQRLWRDALAQRRWQAQVETIQAQAAQVNEQLQARIIQQFWRHVQVKRREREQARRTVIRRWWRLMAILIERDQEQQQAKSATQIQRTWAHYRSKRDTKKFTKQGASTALIQRRWKWHWSQVQTAKQANEISMRRMASAKTIQSWWKAHVGLNQTIQDDSCRRVQRVWRRRKERNAQRQAVAAKVIQAQWRNYSAQVEVTKTVACRDRSSAAIQRIWRRFRNKQIIVAVVIQTTWQRHKVANSARRRDAARKKLQHALCMFYRRRKKRQDDLAARKRQDNASQVIQHWWLAWRRRSQWARQIQRWWRYRQKHQAKLRKAALQNLHAVEIIQRVWRRGLALRKTAFLQSQAVEMAAQRRRQQSAALLIQKAVRPFIEAQSRSSAARVIQSAWRNHTLGIRQCSLTQCAMGFVQNVLEQCVAEYWARIITRECQRTLAECIQACESQQEPLDQAIDPNSSKLDKKTQSHRLQLDITLQKTWQQIQQATFTRVLAHHRRMALLQREWRRQRCRREQTEQYAVETASWFVTCGICNVKAQHTMATKIQQAMRDHTVRMRRTAVHCIASSWIRSKYLQRRRRYRIQVNSKATEIVLQWTAQIVEYRREVSSAATSIVLSCVSQVIRVRCEIHTFAASLAITFFDTASDRIASRRHIALATLKAVLCDLACRRRASAVVISKWRNMRRRWLFSHVFRPLVRSWLTSAQSNHMQAVRRRWFIAACAIERCWRRHQLWKRTCACDTIAGGWRVFKWRRARRRAASCIRGAYRCYRAYWLWLWKCRLATRIQRLVRRFLWRHHAAKCLQAASRSFLAKKVWSTASALDATASDDPYFALWLTKGRAMVTCVQRRKRGSVVLDAKTSMLLNSLAMFRQKKRASRTKDWELAALDVVGHVEVHETHDAILLEMPPGYVLGQILQRSESLAQINQTKATKLTLSALDAVARQSIPDLLDSINDGRDINKRNAMGQSALHLAVSMPKAVDFIDVLLEHGADVNAKDYDGLTPLMVVASHGNLQLLKFVMGRAPSIRLNAVDNKGFSALHHACAKNQVEICDYLVALASDHQVVLNAASYDGMYPLHVLAILGHVECACALQQGPWDVNVCDAEGRTPLHLAIASNRSAFVTFLLEMGADPSAKDALSRTPLHYAMECKLGLEMVSSLRKFKVDLNATDERGDTALHWAAMAGRQKLVNHLVNLGADTSIQNTDWETPAHLAAANGHEGCVAIFNRKRMSNAAVVSQTTPPEAYIAMMDGCVDGFAIPATEQVYMEAPGGDEATAQIEWSQDAEGYYYNTATGEYYYDYYEPTGEQASYPEMENTWPSEYAAVDDESAPVIAATDWSYASQEIPTDASHTSPTEDASSVMYTAEANAPAYDANESNAANQDVPTAESYELSRADYTAQAYEDYAPTHESEDWSATNQAYDANESNAASQDVPTEPYELSRADYTAQAYEDNAPTYESGDWSGINHGVPTDAYESSATAYEVDPAASSNEAWAKYYADLEAYNQAAYTVDDYAANNTYDTSGYEGYDAYNAYGDAPALESHEISHDDYDLMNLPELSPRGDDQVVADDMSYTQVEIPVASDDNLIPHEELPTVADDTESALEEWPLVADESSGAQEEHVAEDLWSSQALPIEDDDTSYALGGLPIPSQDSGQT
ncbi:hypothetical protein AeMF1_012471 [Aphanomyces euteiches]|nr:hypothetical protein AeMF1_012471 [Aphanomyces euteiches]KAH9187525.1 hypothetical protein AeNC1_010499 [Aphanomyces euteiches]